LPHRQSDPTLLVVARWPGLSGRDPAAEAAIEPFLELVRGIRNARAEGGLQPGAWLPLDVHVPEPGGETFEALRPAIERLAHVRPITRQQTPSGLEPARASGGLTVIAGAVEGVLGRPVADEAATTLERTRLQRELADAERLLSAASARLANPEFVARAPAAVVDGARAREADLSEQVPRLRERLGV
jgi:valyl-tRNA synthetase